MSARLSKFLIVAGLAVLGMIAVLRQAPVQANTGVALPPFTQSSPQQWINSAPLTTESLKGKVLLVDFWTFECWNCYRSFPWLNALEAHFADRDFQVIGIHTPEFDHEKEITEVRKKVQAFGLKHPVMIDNDFAYWRAMGNRYWPAYYLVDKTGQVRQVFVGETHQGDSQARRIQSAIATLLAE